MTGNSELFGAVQVFPDPDAEERFDALVGLDEVKARFVTEAEILIDPRILEEWSKRHHKKILAAVRSVEKRAPLLVLSGDVGTGKTELAETVGDPIARHLKMDITLYPLSLRARGKGLVGEMTSLLTQAFEAVRGTVANARDDAKGFRHAAILLIDEADALTQSRELAQMHHEDRAGVNAVIQGIDEMRRDRLPVLTIMCTNRPEALDPAIARRAAHVFKLSRPSPEYIERIITTEFGEIGMRAPEIAELVSLLGPSNGRAYGCTFSDLRQRFVPDAVLDALRRDKPLEPSRLKELATAFDPTRPFSTYEEPI
jgi:AAA+ superfamily predicted ATPase